MFLLESCDIARDCIGVVIVTPSAKTALSHSGAAQCGSNYKNPPYVRCLDISHMGDFYFLTYARAIKNPKVNFRLANADIQVPDSFSANGDNRYGFFSGRLRG